MEEIWSLDAFKKVRIWINEYPNVIQSEKSTYEIKYQGDKRIKWFNGIICVERKRLIKGGCFKVRVNSKN